jgi:hypothetical protein
MATAEREYGEQCQRAAEVADAPAAKAVTAATNGDWTSAIRSATLAVAAERGWWIF